MINPEMLLERLNVELDVSELGGRIISLEELNEELNADLESLKDTKEQFIDFLNWIVSDEIKVEALRLLRGLK